MNSNARRRFKSLLPTAEDRVPRRPVPAPAPVAARRRRGADKAAGSALLFADFLAAAMTLSPDLLADFK